MSFDAQPTCGQNIAIVGGGISGLAAAYLLSPRHRVTLYEAEPRLGGHARTVLAGRNGDRAVDTGFIVFNHVTYPHLTQMFHDLDVPVQRSTMSFGASIGDGRFEYALSSLSSLVAQRRNMIRPPFLRMVRDILHFNAKAEDAARDDSTTIADLVDELRLGEWFRRYYLMPFCGAIWSTPPEEIGHFPARSLVRFFRNHALLGVWGQHQWWTVKGGSAEYVHRLRARVEAQGCVIRTGAPVSAVERDEAGVTIRCAARPAETFDQVVLACHSDEALQALARPTAAERAVLSDIRYRDNHAVLHRDEAQMPRRRACWASWVCRSGAATGAEAQTEAGRDPVSVTYWMNLLQSLPEDDPLFVTLNPLAPIRDDLVYDTTTFRHPVFDRAALRAQARLAGMQGENRTWFAGAYLRHGFHEDGFASALRVARALDTQFA